MDIIENDIVNIGVMSKIATISVELIQNMMHYSKSQDLVCRDIRPAGYIKVTKDKDCRYTISTKNIVSLEDKKIIESRIGDIQTLNISGIKERYKELRRTGEHAHEKGGGIGFYEIAKLANEFNYKFESINDERFYFRFSIMLVTKK